VSREEVILRLLAISASSRSDLVRDTGWGIQETNATVDQLLQAGRITFYPRAGNTRTTAKLLCLPDVRAEAMELRRQR
jgi:hypothetical protein